MSKSRGVIEEDEEDEIESGNEKEIFVVKEGLNDLMNLPIETLRNELKRRNFYPGIVDKMDKWFLASMLRDDVTSYQVLLTKIAHGGEASAPIFSQNDKNKEKEEDTNQDEEKTDEEQHFDPNIFTEGDDPIPTSSLINENATTISPVIYPRKQIIRKNYKPSVWSHPRLHSRLDMLVPIEVLESLPQETQQKIQQDIQNGRDFDDIVAQYLIPDLI